MGYIVKRKGKQMRPMFVFLTAGVCGKISESTYRGASLIELLHTASLVHDDVVDEANYRRGFFSVNALWKNKIAVLVGDFLLARGLILSVENKDFNLLSIVTDAVREMSEGELLAVREVPEVGYHGGGVLRNHPAENSVAYCFVLCCGREFFGCDRGRRRQNERVW